MPAITLRMKAELIELIKSASQISDLPMSIWVRQTLKREAERLFKKNRMPENVQQNAIQSQLQEESAS